MPSDVNGIQRIGNVTILPNGRSIFRTPPGWEETYRTVRRGTHSSRGGCRWESQDTLALGEHRTERTIEFDPTTCERVVSIRRRFGEEALRSANAIVRNDDRGAVRSDRGTNKSLSVDIGECDPNAECFDQS